MYNGKEVSQQTTKLHPTQEPPGEPAPPQGHPHPPAITDSAKTLSSTVPDPAARAFITGR